jgi:hypothetical protein
MGPHLATVPGSVSAQHAQAPRSISQREFTVENGDIVVTRAMAGIWRGGPGLTAPTVQTLPEYRVSIHGETDADERIFEMYGSAIADGDAQAAGRHARLFYTEGNVLTLVKDYRRGATA